ncbi:MAG: glycosyltransferase family 1 protein [Anaerolineae bacterium]|nr:glycosyltransferase family 1 protein [Anaerolineae bacterium]MDQ7034268.1 glycosyltransferase family 1 protein [Anaerolineae bacterium]
MIHIGLNAHLLSSQIGYRSAGIHNVIHQLLAHLPQVAPDDWHFTAMVGSKNQATYPNMSMKHAALDTESPTKRIIWEQGIQPFQLADYDLYHAMAFVAPLFLHKPMVVTVYDLTFMRYPQRLSSARRLYLRMFTEITCKRAKRITAISHSTKQDLVDLLNIPAEKIDVTHLAYDRDTIRPLAAETIVAFKQQKGLPDRFWFYLGTLEPRKNLVMLINAYAKLPENERLPLVLAGGKGWMTDAIFEAVERHGLGDKISFTGFIPTAEMALWYNSAEVFVYPSLFEGFGLPILEAMACGTPVITSNVSSLPEVAEGAGLCLPPHEVSLWADALQRTYHDATWREEASEKGLHKAQQFDWANTAQATVNSYRRALEIT